MLELAYGWKNHQFLSKKQTQFFKRRIYWMIHDPSLPPSHPKLPASFSLIDRCGFNSQFYFLVSLGAQGLILAVFAIELLLRAGTNFFFDPFFPLLSVGTYFLCAASRRPLERLGRLFRIWLVKHADRRWKNEVSLERRKAIALAASKLVSSVPTESGTGDKDSAAYRKQRNDVFQNLSDLMVLLTTQTESTTLAYEKFLELRTALTEVLATGRPPYEMAIEIQNIIFEFCPALAQVEKNELNINFKLAPLWPVEFTFAYSPWVSQSATAFYKQHANKRSRVRSDSDEEIESSAEAMLTSAKKNKAAALLLGGESDEEGPILSDGTAAHLDDRKHQGPSSLTHLFSLLGGSIKTSKSPSKTSSSLPPPAFLPRGFVQSPSKQISRVMSNSIPSSTSVSDADLSDSGVRKVVRIVKKRKAQQAKAAALYAEEEKSGAEDAEAAPTLRALGRKRIGPKVFVSKTRIEDGEVKITSAASEASSGPATAAEEDLGDSEQSEASVAESSPGSISRRVIGSRQPNASSVDGDSTSEGSLREDLDAPALSSSVSSSSLVSSTSSSSPRKLLRALMNRSVSNSSAKLLPSVPLDQPPADSEELSQDTGLSSPTSQSSSPRKVVKRIIVRRRPADGSQPNSDTSAPPLEEAEQRQEEDRNEPSPASVTDEALAPTSDDPPVASPRKVVRRVIRRQPSAALLPVGQEDGDAVRASEDVHLDFNSYLTTSPTSSSAPAAEESGPPENDISSPGSLDSFGNPLASLPKRKVIIRKKIVKAPSPDAE
eukprot:GILI01012922.1.p1 GENE.GILI01012922.1~~GILI01012922.1.p1  ORF type:complete len:832 (+),score=242.88 GILI01012922.1:177-2498(+)